MKSGLPNYENQNEYNVIVTATDEYGNLISENVTVNIQNVDEVIPVITSSETGTTLLSGTGANQIVYTITANARDGGTIQGYHIGGDDVDALSVDSNTGVVKLTGDPDYHTKHTYSFTVTASDESGTSAPTSVTFYISDYYSYQWN